MTPSVFSFFIKEAVGMHHAYLKAKKELASPKPAPVELENPVKRDHLKHIKGLERPRLATPRPKMQGTKRTPISLGGTPLQRLGLKKSS